MDPSNIPALQYQPLNDPKKEIRLLRYEPHQQDSRLLSFSLHSFRTEEAPVYDCLSYTWGDASKTQPILVDSKRFHATENLVAALSRIYRSKTQHVLVDRNLFDKSENPIADRSQICQFTPFDKTSEFIWIDAICIYSDRSSIKHLRNLRSLIQYLKEPNQDLFRSTESPFSGGVIRHVFL
jgi:hypothetical protein